MYGRGNPAPPMGHGSYTSSSIFQQLPHAPTPPCLQGPQGPRPVQHGSLPVPPHGGQQGHPAYQHTPPMAPQPAPPILIPLSGSAQSFLPHQGPPPPLQSLQVQGSSQVQQGSQWSQSTSLVPPIVLSSAPTVRTPPPSQGHVRYGSRGHQPSGGATQAPPPSHQRASGFYASHSVESFGPSVSQHSSMLAVGPPPLLPPLPSSPRGSPPIPPSSSALTSSFFSRSQMPKSIPAVSHAANYFQGGLGVSEGFGFFKSASGYGAEASGACGVGDNGSADLENLVLDLSRPPPKPLDDRIVRKIEILCQFIVKNGPDFENLTREKESRNPEFRFLFGGDPGSEDAVAHKYFIWMRNKCQLECKSVEKHEQSDHPVELLGASLSQPNMIINGGGPYSTADSDMDMEDDITYPDKELKLCSTNDLMTETSPVSRDTGPTDQLQVLHRTTGSILSTDATVMHSQSSPTDELRQGSETLSHQNQSVARKSLVQVDEYVVDSGNIQRPLGGSKTSSHIIQSIEKSLAQVDELVAGSSGEIWRPLDRSVQDSSSSHQDSMQHKESIDLAERELEKLPNQLMKKASPFKLLQDYASEGSSDDEAFQDDVKPTGVLSSIEGGDTTINSHAGSNLGTGLGPKDVLGSAKELETLPESCNSEDFPVRPVNVMMEAEMASASRRSENFIGNISRNQDPVTVGVSDGKVPEKNASRKVNNGATGDKKEDVKVVATMVKVDKFGRKVREGGSDSDSGGSPRYIRRRGKRGRCRSRSRSRSPHARRRSPLRRKERRGRSHSSSPRRRRSRSKSPPYRRGVEYPGGKMRRDRGQPPECFDFIRGKCYRGSSCRFMHNQDKGDRLSSYRTKQQLLDLPPSSRSSDLNDKTEAMRAKKLGHEHREARTQELKSFDMAGIEEKKAFNGPAAEIVGGEDVDIGNLPDDADHKATSINNVEIQQLKSQCPDQILLKSDQQHEQTDNSFAPENFPYEFMSPQASIPPAACHTFPLAPSSLPLPSQEVSSKSTTQQMPGDYSVISTAGKFPPHPASFENYTVHHASVPYPHSQFPLPPNPSWKSTPLPPALPRPLFVNNVTEALAHGRYGFHPVPFQQNMITQKIDFSAQTSTRLCITEFPTHPHLVQNQAYLPIQEPDYPSSRLDSLRPETYPANQQISQSHGGAGFVGVDHLSACRSQGLYSLYSYGQGDSHSQGMPFLEESPSKGLQALDSGNLPAGGSRIPNHFKPYASAFDRPLSSKFSSTNFDAAGLSHISVDARAIETLSSRTMVPTQSSASLPRNGDQYDPLFDSFEPLLNSAQKSVRKLEGTDESHVLLMHNGVDKPLDVEENNKQNDGGAIALTASLENEEYGETADAEVGAVENGSPSNLNDAADVDAGDVEIDQVKTRGKSKRSKDSRSTKHFKVALAGFVKEVLKPSWRQGNMSKEAFKTIVKKTVDKVSGAMKSHHVPRSQAKINHYIDSSQRKLTKLVMGYVDKYVKA